MKISPLLFVFGLVVGVWFFTNYLLQSNITPQQRRFGNDLDRMNERTQQSSCESLESLGIESERCEY